MTSDKQREANRLNAQRSTGPNTPEGKAASSHNAIRHGICVADITLYDDPETREQIEAKIDEYFQYYRPSSPLERDALAEIALLKANQARLDRIENGILNESRERVFAEQHITGPDGKPLYRFDRTQYPPEEQRTVANMHLGAAWLRAQEVMESISRQQARLATRLRRAEQRFDQLQAARQAEPEPEKPVSQNEPISSQLPVVATPPPPILTVDRTPATVPPMPTPAAIDNPAALLKKDPLSDPLASRRTPEKESA